MTMDHTVPSSAKFGVIAGFGSQIVISKGTERCPLFSLIEGRRGIGRNKFKMSANLHSNCFR
jgi:hypothetical protein